MSDVETVSGSLNVFGSASVSLDFGAPGNAKPEAASIGATLGAALSGSSPLGGIGVLGFVTKEPLLILNRVWGTNQAASWLCP